MIQHLAHEKAALLLSVIVMKTGVMIAAMIGATIDAMTAATTGVTTGAMIEVAVTGSNARKKKDSAIFMAVRSYVTEPRDVS
ncbi:hypothetical protein D9M68_877080 [compost metagenome]